MSAPSDDTQGLDEILDEVFIAGVGIAGADDIDVDEKDKAIMNVNAHYRKNAKQAILGWVDKVVIGEKPYADERSASVLLTEQRNVLRQHGYKGGE